MHFKQLQVAVIAGLGGCLFGLDQGLFGKIQGYPSFAPFAISPLALGGVAACLLMGCVVGSMLSSPAAVRFGRRMAIEGALLIYFIGILTQILSHYQLWLLCTGRTITGVSLGMLMSIVPMYVSEVADRKRRGFLVGIQQLSLTIGIFMAFVAGWLVEDMHIGPLQDWQVAILLQCIPAAVMLIGIHHLPSSPRWLILQRRIGEAEQSMRLLVGAQYCSMEFQKMCMDLSDPPRRTMLDVIRRCPRQLAIGMAVHAFQQLAGIKAFMYFYRQMYAEILPDVIDELALLQTLLKVLATLPGILLVDKLGRRLLLRWGAFGCSMACAMLPLAVQPEHHHPYLAVFAVSLFIMCFGVSLGPLPWIITGEIFPSDLRHMAIAMCVVVNLSTSMLVTFVSPLLFAVFHANTFLIFSIHCFFLAIWTMRYLPETKGMSLEQIQLIFNAEYTK